MSSQPPKISERQQAILTIVREQGFSTLEALAARFDVSVQTVRREIIRLDSLGLLQRFHGGVGLRGSTVRLGYAQKRTVAADAKERIGQGAAALIKDGASVFLDVGTTAEAVARALRGRHSLRVFTCSLPAAMLLAGSPGIEVFVTGGLVRGADGSLVGDSVSAAIARFKVDYAVVGFSGVDEDDGALMDFDLQKVAVKQAILANARHTIAVGHGAKLQHPAVVRIAPPAAFGTLVTDEPPRDRLRDLFDAQGLHVEVV
jgi:DeoR family glycerol-3-phosphate regulon repressor